MANTELIVGIVIGVLILLCIGGVIVWLVIRNKRKHDIQMQRGGADAKRPINPDDGTITNDDTGLYMSCHIASPLLTDVEPWWLRGEDLVIGSFLLNCNRNDDKSIQHLQAIDDLDNTIHKLNSHMRLLRSTSEISECVNNSHKIVNAKTSTRNLTQYINNGKVDNLYGILHDGFHMIGILCDPNCSYINSRNFNTQSVENAIKLYISGIHAAHNTLLMLYYSGAFKQFYSLYTNILNNENICYCNSNHKFKINYSENEPYKITTTAKSYETDYICEGLNCQIPLLIEPDESNISTISDEIETSTITFLANINVIEHHLTEPDDDTPDDNRAYGHLWKTLCEFFAMLCVYEINNASIYFVDENNIVIELNLTDIKPIIYKPKSKSKSKK